MCPPAAVPAGRDVVDRMSAREAPGRGVDGLAARRSRSASPPRLLRAQAPNPPRSTSTAWIARRPPCASPSGPQTNPSPHALAWTLEGGTWQLGALPAMTGSSELRRISCPAAASAWRSEKPAEAALAMRLSGGVWTVLPMPKSDRSADLFGVSCPSTRWCMAAGQGSGLKSMVSAVFTGGRWRAVSSPAIKGASLVTLNDVDCASRRFCMAVGNTTDFGSTLHGELVTVLYNGSSWRVVPVPISFPRTLPSLNGVSCPRAGECVAVGNRNFYTASPGRQLIIRFRAGHWTVMSARAPAETEPLSVSCTAPGRLRGGRGEGSSAHPSWSGSHTAAGRCSGRRRRDRRRWEKTEPPSTTASPPSPARRAHAAWRSAPTTAPRSARRSLPPALRC